MSLDIENPAELLAYLRREGHIGARETPEMRTLAGGVSNRTVLVTRAAGEAWVLKQALAKLRVQVDWFSSPTRVHREAMGLRTLRQLTPPGTIPALIFEDHAAHLIGMAAVAQPHENWKQMLLAGHLDLDHVAQFAQILAAIHGGAWRQRATLAPEFADRSFFESLRLEPYYGYTAAQLPWAADFLRTLIAQTRQRALTLVHGDYSPKNVLVREGRLVLLDHEVIHWGDPAFDIGFAMTHLLSKAHYLTNQRAAFTQAAQLFWNRYKDGLTPEGQPAESWLRELEDFAVRHTLACLLARAAGRSPLEYLSPTQRQKQAAAAQVVIDDKTESMEDLIHGFVNSV
ncbi:MAG: phosphotransferase [Caldilineaceae bacterium]